MTVYTQENVKVFADVGQLLTLQKVAVNIPEQEKIDRLTQYRSHVSITGTITIFNETYQILAGIMGLKRTQKLPTFEQITLVNDPGGGNLPFTVVCRSVKVSFSVSESDVIEGGAMIFDLPFTCKNALVNGVLVNEEYNAVGI